MLRIAAPVRSVKLFSTFLNELLILPCHDKALKYHCISVRQKFIFKIVPLSPKKIMRTIAQQMKDTFGFDFACLKTTT